MSAASVMTAMEEPWLHFCQDPRLRKLFLQYGEEFDVTCDPNWEEATRLYRMGEFKVIGLRANGQLVGFCLCRILASLSFKGQKMAIATEIYVEPEHRGRKGTYLLLEVAIACMRKAGCRQFSLHHGVIDPAVLAPLGRGIGMRVWSKAL